ncbi:anti-sigma regulatory factor [Rhodococcus sp. 15-649-1-2]|nr:ATP-binding protein [Rhodococcus sp. 15-649-1-2]OZE84749.1 anti-sigma regulatory factor [Rhodococcus sp. 15-649-1-2]
MTERNADHRAVDPARWTHHGHADPSSATMLRRRVRRWAASFDVTEDLVDAIELATYEALANVVEHAYTTSDKPGIMTLTAVREASTITITVADAGIWKPPDPTPHRRHGLDLAAAVSDHFALDHSAVGTVVSMTWALD